MKNFALPLLCLAFAATAAYGLSSGGCGGNVVGQDPGTADMTVVAASSYSCDQRTASPPVCKEFSNLSSTTTTSDFQGLCAVQIAAGPCTRANSLGGCQAANSQYTLTNWFYTGGSYTTTSQVQSYCTSISTTYVPAN